LLPWSKQNPLLSEVEKIESQKIDSTNFNTDKDKLQYLAVPSINYNFRTILLKEAFSRTYQLLPKQTTKQSRTRKTEFQLTEKKKTTC
jgi:hypothetical protein